MADSYWGLNFDNKSAIETEFRKIHDMLEEMLQEGSRTFYDPSSEMPEEEKKQEMNENDEEI